MPEQDQSTTPPVPPTPPRFPKLSYAELEARRALMHAAGKLAVIRAELWNIHVSLEISEEQERAIEENEQPETLAFAYRGTIECVNGDDLDPAIKSLEQAALLGPGTLLSEWQERTKARTSRGEETRGE